MHIVVSINLIAMQDKKKTNQNLAIINILKLEPEKEVFMLEPCASEQAPPCHWTPKPWWTQWSEELEGGGVQLVKPLVVLLGAP